MSKTNLRTAERLLARIEKIPVIDTHEHMALEADFVRGEYDFTHLLNYTALDLGLAGVPVGCSTTTRGACSISRAFRPSPENVLPADAVRRLTGRNRSRHK